MCSSSRYQGDPAAHVLDVKIVQPYILDVQFEDGTVRRVDVEQVLWGTMFEQLRDPQRFYQASVDPELGTVTWPNGADLAPEYLYSHSEIIVQNASA